jgi:photosystem II S4 domain protein
MVLPREQVLAGCHHRPELEALIALAEQAIRTWEPVWSGFMAAEVREEAEQRLGALSELELSSAGGWPQAERRRLRLQRAELEPDAAAAPLMGLVLSGNFLFDPAEPADVRRGLEAAGAGPEAIGDIWMRGDRGAQLVVTPELATQLHGQTAQVRTVAVQLEATPLEQLQLPAQRIPKQLSSVEASLRLDAVASAGFGLSRSRMAELIRGGAVRINWRPVTSPSKELAAGDRVQLQGRGELEILEIQPTKRERWRLLMRRA